MQVQKIRNGRVECWDPLYQAAYNTVLHETVRADYRKRFEYYEYLDIVDEAFYLCYAQLERYRGWSRFSGWVGGYARNITRNRCSRERTRWKYHGLARTENIRMMESCDPVTILICRERNACLWKAFFEMDPIDRTIVSDRIFEGKSFAGIAQELCLSRKETLQRYGVSMNYLRQHFVQYYSGCVTEDEKNANIAWRVT